MCGRYVTATPLPLLLRHFRVAETRVETLTPRWNVAPTDAVPVVAEHDGVRLLGTMRWGLVPSWATDTSGAARMINARAETVLDKPAFREAFLRRRCLLPADGFYEWRLGPGGLKQPLYLHAADAGPLEFAGLWDVWRDPADPTAAPLRTCTILTTAANATVGEFHSRMPVVLPESAWDPWLSRDERDTGLLRHLLADARTVELAVTPVGTRVNDVRNDDPALLEPVARTWCTEPSR